MVTPMITVTESILRAFFLPEESNRLQTTRAPIKTPHNSNSKEVNSGYDSGKKDASGKGEHTNSRKNLMNNGT